MKIAREKKFELPPYISREKIIVLEDGRIKPCPHIESEDFFKDVPPPSKEGKKKKK